MTIKELNDVIRAAEFYKENDFKDPYYPDSASDNGIEITFAASYVLLLDAAKLTMAKAKGELIV